MASISANGAKGHHKFTLVVSETSTSKEGNSSAISYQFSISPVVSSYDWKSWGNSIKYTVTVNGTSYSGTIPDYDGYSTVVLKSGNLSVPHNADGTKTMSFGFTVTDGAGMSYTCGNASATGSMTLTRILRNPPTLAVSVEDTNSATLALTGNKATLVRYFSNASYSATATAHDGASIASISATCGTTVLSGKSGVFEKVESGSFAFTATDSYGNSTSKDLSLTIIPYVRLSCNPEMTRPDVAGNMTVSVSGNCFNGSFGKKSNTLTVTFRYKQTGGSYGSWTAMTASRSGNSYTAQGKLTGLDYQKTYVFQVKAVDLLDTVQTAEFTAKAVPVFDWGKDDFNVNGTLKINSSAVADFVTEHGTSGSWQYRKWNSGVAECWGETAFTITFVGTSPAYHSKDKFQPKLPTSLFTEVTTAVATVQNSAAAYVFGTVYGVSKASLDICFGRLYGGIGDVPATVRMYVIGKWK